MILIYITCSNEEEAENIASILIENKLVACGNIFPIKSIYNWEGKITKEKESVLILKTDNSKYETVKTEVEKIHSYKIPCILKIEADSNEKYLNWLKGEIS